MFTPETQARLAILRQYLPKGYAEKVWERAKERGEKIGLSAVYKVASGKMYNLIIFEEIMRIAGEEQDRLKNLEQRLTDTLTFFENRKDA